MSEGLKMLPGFTADEGLYHSQQTYSSHGQPYMGGSPASAATIVPQQYTCTPCYCIGWYCWKQCCYCYPGLGCNCNTVPC